MVKISRFLLAAALALAAHVSRAAEEYSLLVPPAFSPAVFGEDGAVLRRVSSIDPAPEPEELQELGRNTVRLSLPLPPQNPEAKLRMMEASPAGPDGALQFKPTESMPGTLHASIPGLVPPEVLVMSRMARGGAGGTRSGGGFAPISLPTSLGTEELREFDPNAVQEAFPAAARGKGQAFAGWPFVEDNAGRRRPGAAHAPRPGSAHLPPAPGSLSLDPVVVPVPPVVDAMPPLPELPVGGGGMRAAETARRAAPVASALDPTSASLPLRPPLPGAEAGPESLSGGLRPAPLPQPELEQALAASDAGAPRGLLLPLPPLGVGESVSLLPAPVVEERIVEEKPKPQAQSAGRSRRTVKRKGAAAPVRANEFTPMRGVRVY